MDSTDRKIIELVKLQKEDGIKLLFRRYYRPMVCYAVDLTGEKDVAEDLVQELFVRIWEDNKLSDFIPDSLSSYLFTAVRNSCISWRRKKDVLRNYKNLQQLDIPVEIVAPINEELIQQLMVEIEQLPHRTRQALECVMIQKMKYKEAAEVMGISVNTIKYLLKEGTRRLRSKLSLIDDSILLHIFTYCSEAMAEITP